MNETPIKSSVWLDIRSVHCMKCKAKPVTHFRLGRELIAQDDGSQQFRLFYEFICTTCADQEGIETQTFMHVRGEG